MIEVKGLTKRFGSIQAIHDLSFKIEKGEIVVLCRRNIPIAEIRPIPRSPAEPRPVGIDRGMTVPDSFFEPLPADLLDAFEGGGPSG